MAVDQVGQIQNGEGYFDTLLITGTDLQSQETAGSNTPSGPRKDHWISISYMTKQKLFPQVLKNFIPKVQKYDREVAEDGTSAFNPCHWEVLVKQAVNPRKQVSIHTLQGQAAHLPQPLLPAGQGQYTFWTPGWGSGYLGMHKRGSPAFRVIFARIWDVI